MRNGLRLDVWIVGLVVTVCLMGVAGASYRFNFAGIQDLLPRSIASSKIPHVSSTELAANTASAVMLRENPVSPRIPQSARTATPPAVTRATVRRPAIPSVAGEPSRSPIKPREATASVPVAASPEPQRKVFAPLGYVQEANGSVEAIITQRDNTVAVIHVGDAYDVNGEKFTVAKISSRAVEIVAAAAPQVSPSAVESVFNSAPTSKSSVEVLTASARQVKHTPPSNPLPAEGKSVQFLQSSKIISRQSTIRISAARNFVEPETSIVRSSGRRVALANPVSPGPKTIGYAEKSDGTRVVLVADGESVRLVTENKSLAAQSETPNTLVASENTKISPFPASRPNSSQPNSDRNYGGTPPALAARSAKAGRPARVNSAFAISSVPPGLATRTLSFRDNKIALVPAKRAVVTPTRAAATPRRAVIPPERTETPPTTIGLIERANGKIEAIVDEDEGQGVHFVPVRDSNPPTLMAAAKSMKPIELPTRDSGRDSGQPPQAQVRPPDDDHGSNIIITAATTDVASASPSTRRRAASTTEIASSGTEKEVAGHDPPPPVSEPRDPPPNAEIAWEKVQRAEGEGEALPEREQRAVAAPPRTDDPVALAASGSPPAASAEPAEVASVRGPPASVLFESLSLPSEQRLDLLGEVSPSFAPDRSVVFDFWNGKLPAAEKLSEVSFSHEKPPPEPDRSKGLEEGLADGAPDAQDTPPDQRGPPQSLAPRPAVRGASKDNAESAEDNAGVPSLKYLGYVEWQGGLTLAVVDDSEEGIRLVHEGDIVGDRFRVVKVQPGSVDIVELPAGLPTPVAVQLPASALSRLKLYSRSAPSPGPARATLSPRERVMIIHPLH